MLAALTYDNEALDGPVRVRLLLRRTGSERHLFPTHSTLLPADHERNTLPG